MGEFASSKMVVRCASLEASRDFYTRVLDLRPVEQWEEPQGRGLILALGGRAFLEMYEMAAADPRYDPRFREPVPSDKVDLQLETDSLDPWVARLSGRWQFDGPEELPWGQRWIKLRDPDGLLIAIYIRASA